MKGIKPTSYLNNMIIYTNPQPARRNGREAAWRLLLGQPSQRAGPGGPRGAERKGEERRGGGPQGSGLQAWLPCPQGCSHSLQSRPQEGRDLPPCSQLSGPCAP